MTATPTPSARLGIPHRSRSGSTWIRSDQGTADEPWLVIYRDGGTDLATDLAADRAELVPLTTTEGAAR
jgi:hypothetical protein